VPSNIRFLTKNSGASNPTEKVRILENGSVGIGTSAPQGKLHIVGTGNTASSSLIYLRDSNATSVNTSYGGIVFSSSPGADYFIAKKNVNANGFLVLGTTSGNLDIMTLTSTGNVGIGTNAPAHLLSVVSTSNTQGIQIRRNSNTTNDYGLLGFRVADTEGTINTAEIRAIRTNRAIGGDTDLAIHTFTNGTLAERLRIRDDGLVGINETSPSAQLQVKSGATTRVPLIVDTLASHTASLAEFKLNNVAQAYFESDGGLRTPILRNLATSANSTISVSNTGAVITRNVADTNPALIVNLANASATAQIQVWQQAGNARAFVNRDGFIGSVGTHNITSADNSFVTLATTGTTISRNVADGNHALIVNLASATSTGSITQFQWQGTTQASIARDGIANFTGTPSNEQTGNYTLVLADKGKVLRVNSSSNRTITIPKNSAVAFPIDTEIAILRYGSGTVSIAPVDGDVTLQSADGERKIRNRYGSVALKKIGTDEWVLVGSLEA
jgi:hypothetical protein